MRPICYAAPRNLSEALALLAEHGSAARILAGGTDLIPQLNEYLVEADIVVDAKRIPELMALTVRSDGGVSVGAAVPCYRIYEDHHIRAEFPGLVDAVSIIGSTAIQGRASIGGNLCNSGPAADSIPAMIACGAEAAIYGPAGRRSVPVHQFCIAPGRNVLEPGEMLAAIDIPPRADRTGAAYLRFIPRNEMDIAVVGVGVSLTLDGDLRTIRDARIALGAVAPTPLLVESAGGLLTGRAASDEAFRDAAAAAQAACSPISDMRGTAEHRRHLVGVMTRRALQRALERAGKN